MVVGSLAQKQIGVELRVRLTGCSRHGSVLVSGGACVVCPEGVTLIWSTSLKKGSRRGKKKTTHTHTHLNFQPTSGAM